MRKKILHQEVLKLIACVTMLIDHFGAAIVPTLPVPYMVDLYYACRIIGRLAFPIYCFLLAEGIHHTRNAGKYILRLGIGILLAELPFDFLFEGGFTWEYQNVMVTLTLGAVMLWTMGKTKNYAIKLLLTIPFAVLADLTKCDYGAWGIAMIAVFGLTDRWPLQLLFFLWINCQLQSAEIFIMGIPFSVQLFATAALLPIHLYSGKKLTRNRAVQWGFYLFYPVHLLVLWIVLGFLR